MNKAAFFLAGLLGIVPVFGEGEVGSQAFQWSGYSDLAPSPTAYSLASYQGKVVLLVVFQYNCGGCVANAPRLGRLVDTLDRSADSAKFQAVGAEITTATYAQIQNYRNSLTNTSTLALNFPLVKVPSDTAVVNDPSVNGTRWRRYDSPRDVYFVIGHDGLIKARVAGNRASIMTNTLYLSLRTALNDALAAVPSSLAPGAGNSAGFRAERIGRGFRFRLNDELTGTVSLRISDLQGRAVRSFSLTSTAPEAIWNGLDASGNNLPYGMYFVQATGAGISLRQRIPLLP